MKYYRLIERTIIQNEWTHRYFYWWLGDGIELPDVEIVAIENCGMMAAILYYEDEIFTIQRNITYEQILAAGRYQDNVVKGVVTLAR